MQDYRLTTQELAKLRAAHREARNAREAYRLNAVILLGSGWSAAEVSTALLMDDPEFQWLNTVLRNVRNSLQGSCHQANGKHLPHYLGEFCYRFNRCFDLAEMPPRLGWAAVRKPPMPHRLLLLAEPF